MAWAGEAQAGWLLSTNLLRLHDLHPDQVELDLLLAYLSRPDVQKWITDRAETTVIPFINTATLGQLAVALHHGQQHRDNHRGNLLARGPQ